LLGAWGAVFSSLFGVWQSVPYLFADFWGLVRRRRDSARGSLGIDTRGPVYRGYLLALATIPLAGLFTTFERVQKLYAIFGALFMPMLAAALLVLNGRVAWVGHEYRNRPLTTALLLATLLLFASSATLRCASPKTSASEKVEAPTGFDLKGNKMHPTFSCWERRLPAGSWAHRSALERPRSRWERRLPAGSWAKAHE